ncbi:Hypothetical_protein [Hexamita inflata]|uniref:Hypothetical_protein n=1 Tax=Hexamita inflata TaxID=28002 RepID=A0AA86P3U4_9EUKA|nr:Hypothetical protein HINF_LOCUS4958 [Hexamita inflata]CAI9931148.1 Hypothetical protein HINF_LOCUS18793 [Hexamita inflata]
MNSQLLRSRIANCPKATNQEIALFLQRNYVEYKQYSAQAFLRLIDKHRAITTQCSPDSVLTSLSRVEHTSIDVSRSSHQPLQQVFQTTSKYQVRQSEILQIVLNISSPRDCELIKTGSKHFQLKQVEDQFVLSFEADKKGVYICNLKLVTENVVTESIFEAEVLKPESQIEKLQLQLEELKKTANKIAPLETYKSDVTKREFSMNELYTSRQSALRDKYSTIAKSQPSTVISPSTIPHQPQIQPQQQKQNLQQQSALKDKLKMKMEQLNLNQKHVQNDPFDGLIDEQMVHTSAFPREISVQKFDLEPEEEIKPQTEQMKKIMTNKIKPNQNEDEKADIQASTSASQLKDRLKNKMKAQKTPENLTASQMIEKLMKEQQKEIPIIPVPEIKKEPQIEKTEEKAEIQPSISASQLKDRFKNKLKREPSKTADSLSTSEVIDNIMKQQQTQQPKENIISPNVEKQIPEPIIAPIPVPEQKEEITIGEKPNMSASQLKDRFKKKLKPTAQPDLGQKFIQNDPFDDDPIEPLTKQPAQSLVINKMKIPSIEAEQAADSIINQIKSNSLTTKPLEIKKDAKKPAQNIDDLDFDDKPAAKPLEIKKDAKKPAQNIDDLDFDDKPGAKPLEIKKDVKKPAQNIDDLDFDEPQNNDAFSTPNQNVNIKLKSHLSASKKTPLSIDDIEDDINVSPLQNAASIKHFTIDSPLNQTVHNEEMIEQNWRENAESYNKKFGHNFEPVIFSELQNAIKLLKE